MPIDISQSAAHSFLVGSVNDQCQYRVTRVGVESMVDGAQPLGGVASIVC
jgi:hypothetical protein